VLFGWRLLATARVINCNTQSSTFWGTPIFNNLKGYFPILSKHYYLQMYTPILLESRSGLFHPITSRRLWVSCISLRSVDRSVWCVARVAETTDSWRRSRGSRRWRYSVKSSLFTVQRSPCLTRVWQQLRKVSQLTFPVLHVSECPKIIWTPP